MKKNQTILNDNDFEALKLYEPDSPVHKLVGEKIKEVFAKMFKNTDVNIDDFYFTVVEDENPNAFFISKEKTVDKQKNIIAVTVGMIDFVENIEQFAAVIGHESGHYIWDELLGGKNTIFQERAADLRSVDLLINAGYNPRNVLEIQKKIGQKYLKNPRNLTIDVHGVQSARIADIEAYLTKIANDQGAFPEVAEGVSPEWDNFKTQVYNTRKNNPYNSYLEKVLISKFNTKIISKINNSDLFDVLIYELDAGNINTNARVQDLLKILDNIVFIKKPNSEQVADLVYKTYKNTGLLEKNNGTVNEIVRFLLRANINSAGVFKEIIDLRKKFVDAANNFDKKTLVEVAPKLKEYGVLIFHGSNFKDYDEKAEILVPQGEKNIGYLFPWREVLYDTSDDVADVFRNYFYSVSSYDNKHSKVLKNYYLEQNENGKFVVRDFGKSALEKNNKLIENIYDEASKRQTEDFKKYIDKLSLLAQYGRGDISAEQLSGSWGQTVIDFILYLSEFNEKKLLQYIVWDGNKKAYLDLIGVKIDDFKYDKEKTKEYKDILQNSIAYDYFIKDDKLAEFYKENTIYALDVKYFNTFYSRIVSILFKFNEFYKDKEIYGHEVKDFCNALEQNYLGGSFSDHKSLYIESLDKNRKFKEIKENEEQWHKKEKENIRRRVAELESLNIGCLKDNFSSLKKCIIKDFEDNKPSVLLENTIKTIGLKIPTNQDELESVIDAYKENGIKGFHFNVFADYLRRGYMFDPIKMFVEKFDDMNPVSETISSDIISAAFERNFVIESLPLKDKMALYQFFEKYRVFSGKIANKNKWIKIIVDEIIKTNSYEYAKWFLMRADLRDGSVYNRSSNDLEFVVEREKLIEFYADYQAKELGIDDLSADFEMRAQRVADEISGGINGDESNKKFSYQVAKGLLDKISSKILSQEKVAQIFDDAATRKISGKDAQNYDFYGRVVENLIFALGEKTSSAQAGIEFLNEKLSDKSIERFLSKLDDDFKKYYYVSNYLNKQDLTMLHENFWAANLEIRAYLMSRLLDAYSGGDKQKSIDLAVDLFFDKNSEYYKDAKTVVNSVYNNLEDYEQNLILAAITAASQRDENSQMTGGETIGRGLKMFFAAKGAAFIKFGQLLSYMPMLDSDIRKELSTMRDQAKIPTRMELIDLIKASVPENEQKNISYVGKILGAGSFFVTVQIKYQGQDAVIALKRPYTDELTNSGMNLINNVIDDLAKKDSKYKPLKNIANQAELSAESEIDIQKDYEKYQNAVKIYESISVETPSGVWQPDVAKWLAYGSTQNGENAYKIMEMAPGESLISDKMTEQEKHDAAVAYVTLELSILLSGQQWDTDRHQGQQNFYNSDFKNFVIGIFDTGAQMDNEPSEFDKRMLGALLYSLVSAVKSGKSVSDVLMQKVNRLDNFSQKLGKDTLYIDGVQRGLTALSDIIEYQKEIKDENGNVIQESRSLTPEDMANIIGAINKSGLIDKTVKRSVVGAAVIDNIIPNKNTFALLDMLKSEKESDIVVNYKPIEKQVDLERQDMSLQEKQNFIDAKRQFEHLGIKKGLTEKVQFVPDVGGKSA